MIFGLVYNSSIIVADKWSPALQIRTVLLSIQALLSAPNPDDPLANDVAGILKCCQTRIIKFLFNIISSLTSILAILYISITELWKVNEAEAIRNAKEWTRNYAMGN